MEDKNLMYIDETALDAEALEQAELMKRYGDEEAYWENRKNIKQANLDSLEARLDLDIRKNPEKYEITKVVEKVVSSTILASEEYQEALAEVNEASYEFKCARSNVRAVEHRKSMIQSLVNLHGQQYFAGPFEQKELDERRGSWKKRKEEKASEAISQNTKRRRRK